MKRNPLIAVAILLLPVAAVQGQDTPLWRYITTEKISFYQVTPLGDLVVGTKDQIVSLNPETGEVQWTRSDIQKLQAERFNPIQFTPYAVVRTKDGIALIDLATGETLWNSTTMPLKKVRGHLTVPQQNLVLVYGEAPESKRTLVAVDIATGEVRWRQDTLFRKSPKLVSRSLAGHQPPLVDTDSTFILNISKDGPMRIHSRTGELLWRADLNRNPPMLSAGYAPMVYGDGVLYVPYEMALNTSDGSVIWDREDQFSSRVIQMELTPHGLVVRGQRSSGDRYRIRRSFIDLVDPETGISIWEGQASVAGPFIVEEDAIFFATVVGVREQRQEVAGALAALAFADGSAQLIAVVEPDIADDGILAQVLKESALEGKPRSGFPPGELPDRVERVGTDFLLSSDQAFTLVNRAGTVQYHRYYEAPTKGLFESSNAPPPSRKAEHWANFVYVYTKQPDSSGREGFSLVKLDKRDGQEVGRVWKDKKRPDYVLDPMSGFVFVKVNKKEINAHKFPEN